MSSRSIRKPRRVPEPEIVNHDVSMLQATAAASRAMRGRDRSSQESKTSYDRLGGPANIAIPRRRPGSSLRYAENGTQGSFPAFATPLQSTERGSGVCQASRGDDSAVLPPITEFKGLDGRNSSVPSSYRRLRKAKSMFSTRQRTSRTPYGVPALPCGDPSDPERSPGFHLPRTMRRTMSFLNGSGQLQADQDAKIHDESLRLARSQFNLEFEDVGIQTRRSSFLLRRRREHRPFRKTFRATSEGGTDQDTGGPRNKSRSISSSIKTRFKRVFGFSKMPEESASQADTKYAEPSKATHIAAGSQDRSRRESEETQRYIAPSPSLDMPYAPSCDSIYTGKSRVTSWADSSMADTVTTRKPGHRRSLSYIREDGDLDQMMSASDMRDSGSQFPLGVRSDSRRLGVVDSHDLYSALIEQMGRNALSNPNEGIVFGSMPEHSVIPERTTSVYSQRGKRSVRRVPSEESSTSLKSFATARGGDQSSPRTYCPHLSRSFVPMQTSWGMTVHAASQHVKDKSPRSMYAAGEGSEDDDGSIIIAQFGVSKRDVMSPSVYSRSTSGNTPTNADSTDLLDTLDLHNGPGTATIFAPQRTTYSSPKRSARIASSRTHIKPSADWQQWISSQIDRIEQASPTREHVREDAQFQDDDEYFTNLAHQTPIPKPVPTSLLNDPTSQIYAEHKSSAEIRVPSQGNFSRPFGQASNMGTILASQKFDSGNTAQTHSSTPATGTVAMSNENASPKSSQIAQDEMLSPIRIRSSNMQPPESPTPERTGAKRSWTQEQHRRYSARRPPIAQDGKPGQFRSMRNQRDTRGNNENLKHQHEFSDMMENYHLRDIHSTISNKRMVDMFLDSRRHQMGGATDYKTSTEAFI
ncbi:hypothetical protein PENANT_c038G03823 [Penicillium antarcticum]|uniref:Uncharacterized protein n=1 Tax=Penicillium antarcticum TaxID=416450 RepID=A0A1V6PUJ2_9EURO|nr:uncharacterized protein N7508_002143 [Penicillium antarcticum]KAJ5317635.1 hypothetical protein N7508_002143 [Penicillium antarcticum]OQD80156.1 hypothetical protein PENANT_c038G03823 [Penicillium antarcticum]